MGMAMRERPTTTVRESPGRAQLYGRLAQTQHTRPPPQVNTGGTHAARGTGSAIRATSAGSGRVGLRVARRLGDCVTRHCGVARLDLVYRCPTHGIIKMPLTIDRTSQRPVTCPRTSGAKSGMAASRFRPAVCRYERNSQAGNDRTATSPFWPQSGSVVAKGTQVWSGAVYANTSIRLQRFASRQQVF